MKVLATLMIFLSFKNDNAVVRAEKGRKKGLAKKGCGKKCLSTLGEIQAALTEGTNSGSPKVDISICPNTKINFLEAVQTGVVPGSPEAGPLPITVSCCGRGCVFDGETSDGELGKHLFVVGENFDTYHSTSLVLNDISIVNADEFFVFYLTGTTIALNNVKVANVEKVLQGYTCRSPHCEVKPCC